MNIESDVMLTFYPYGGDFLLNEACSFAYDGEGGRVCGKHGIEALFLLCGVARVGVPQLSALHGDKAAGSLGLRCGGEAKQ